jgi:hypothetical protein
VGIGFAYVAASLVGAVALTGVGLMLARSA